MNFKIIQFLFATLILTSCAGTKISTSRFMPLSDSSQLSGRYVNQSKDKRLLDMMLLKDYEYNDEVDVINIYSPSKDSLIVSYLDTDGSNKYVRLKGKMKKNYFEYYLERERFCIPLVYCSVQIERVRIGKGVGEKLEVHRHSDHFGMLFVFNGMSFYDHLALFDPYEGKDLTTHLFRESINSKWGYKNQKDSMVIAPQYDYAQAFDKGVAKVALNNKWGYIDSTNQIVIPIVYDLIMAPQDSLLRVKKDSRWGVINFENKMIVPLVYDDIDEFGYNLKEKNDSHFIKLSKVRKNNKIGFIDTKGKVIIPIEYDGVDPYFKYTQDIFSYYVIIKEGKFGYISGRGVFCEPVFDKVDDYGLRDNHGYDDNDKIVDRIGEYVKVTFGGEPYILGENGMIYPYKEKSAPILSFGKSPTLNVDFDNGIKVGK